MAASSSSSSSFASWMTHISQGVQIEISKLSGVEVGSVITRGRRSVPASMLPKTSQDVSHWKAKRLDVSLHVFDMPFLKGYRVRFGLWVSLRGWKGTGSSRAQSSAVITPTHVNHARWAHLFWLVRSRKVRVCLQPPTEQSLTYDHPLQ